MAVVREMDQAGWIEWVKSRPPALQEMCKRLPPDRLYRLEDTGQRVTIASYEEGGTVTVIVSGKYNAVMFERQVFGVDPKTLQECDVPGVDELVGAMFTDAPMVVDE